MLSSYLVGLLLWLAYGLMLHAGAVIWANAITSCLVGVAIFLKLTQTRGAESATGQPRSSPEPAAELE